MFVGGGEMETQKRLAVRMEWGKPRPGMLREHEQDEQRWNGVCDGVQQHELRGGHDDRAVQAENVHITDC